MTGNNNSDPSVGFITPPRWLDIAPQEFSRLTGHGIKVVQTLMDVPDFEYQADRFPELLPEIRRNARLLAQTGVSLIAQSGTQFTLGYAQDPEDLRSVGRQLEAELGIPVIFNGLALVDAVRAIGARRVAVAGAYYDEDLSNRFAELLENHGIEVAWMQNWVKEGRFRNQENVSGMNWCYDNDWGYQSIRSAAAGAANIDCVVLPGAEIRTLGMLNALEAEIGCPLVAADTAFYWKICASLDREAGALHDGTLFK